MGDGHLPGARVVPLSTLKADPRRKLPRDRVLFVCAGGVRSMTAARLAEELGCASIYSLNGGTQGGIKARLPVDVPGESRQQRPRRAHMPWMASTATTAAAYLSAASTAWSARTWASCDTGLGRQLLGQIELARAARR